MLRNAIINKKRLLWVKELLVARAKRSSALILETTRNCFSCDLMNRVIWLGINVITIS